jgi:hypothetical protein
MAHDASLSKMRVDCHRRQLNALFSGWFPFWFEVIEEVFGATRPEKVRSDKNRCAITFHHARVMTLTFFDLDARAKPS